MVVIVPSEIKFRNNGTLWITGSANTMSLPSALDDDVFLAASLGAGMGTITGCLFNIPVEHITFASDPIQDSRGEDAIIAFTWVCNVLVDH